MDSEQLVALLDSFGILIHDESAAYLRQTIALSPYDTPEFRNLFNAYFKNAAGKKRIEAAYSPVQVPEGVSQVRSLSLQ